jgi:hypothetical protein
MVVGRACSVPEKLLAVLHVYHLRIPFILQIFQDSVQLSPIWNSQTRVRPITFVYSSMGKELCDLQSRKHILTELIRLWGNQNHLANVAKALREKHSEDTLHILVAKRNSGSFTYDGIELGGERVCQETEEEIKRLTQEGYTVKKLSIVGYSLGGLVGRYAVGLLYTRGVFDNILPVVSCIHLLPFQGGLPNAMQNFTTLATPHLGVRTPLRGWHNHIWNVFGARTLSMSGRQLFTIDNFRDTGRPLLSILADPDSVFIKGLALFKRRTLYTNIVNDRTAVYYTTGISKTDPFTNLDKVKLSYLEGYNDVILDPIEPVVPPEPKKVQIPTLYTRFTTGARTFLNRIPLAVALIIFIPIGAVAFLINSALQTMWSSRRIRLHEAGKAGIEIATYRTPLLINSMRGAIEDTYENLNSTQDNDYLSPGGEEEAMRAEGDSSLWRDPSESPITSSPEPEIEAREKTAKPFSATPSTASITSLDNAIRTQAGNLNIPTLALTPDQFAMIETLDNAGWRKYPVYIHNDRHSHAAIIVRSNKNTFNEGYSVLRHWLEEEFLLI